MAPGPLATYVRRWPLISASSRTPPSDIRWNGRSNARAMDCPSEVLPVPGGPTNLAYNSATCPKYLLQQTYNKIGPLTALLPEPRFGWLGDFTGCPISVDVALPSCLPASLTSAPAVVPEFSAFDIKANAREVASPAVRWEDSLLEALPVEDCMSDSRSACSCLRRTMARYSMSRFLIFSSP